MIVGAGRIEVPGTVVDGGLVAVAAMAVVVAVGQLALAVLLQIGRDCLARFRLPTDCSTFWQVY